MRIEIDDMVIEYNVQYGKTKKLVIQVDETGFVTIKAPNNTDKEEIINAIKQHGKLIIEKLNQISKIKERPKTRSYDEQGKFLHLGKEYFLHELIDVEGLSEEELKDKLKKFYISSCKKIVADRIKIYQGQLGVKPKSIEVDESKTKWGTCNSDKKLTFNYKLVMAPMEAIDYVVVHELCHILHMNHDRSFWRKVGSIFPNYKKKQELLARYGNYMII